MNGNQWKLPLNLAIGFHLLVGVSVIYGPGLFESKPRFEEIYTVNFVNLEEAVPSEPAPTEQSVQEQQPVPSASEAIDKEAVSIAEPAPAPEPVSAPPQTISIKPLKKKKKKKIVQPKRNNQEAIKKQRIAEMQRAQKEAEEQAKVLAEEAERQRQMLERTRNSFQKRNPETVRKSTGRNTGAISSSSAASALENRYYASITSKLQMLWLLPEYKQWDPNLSTIVEVTIRKNGEIADSFFLQKSGDRMYDKFVIETINDIGSFSPIPPALKKQRMSIELEFTPGEIR